MLYYRTDINIDSNTKLIHHSVTVLKLTLVAVLDEDHDFVTHYLTIIGKFASRSCSLYSTRSWLEQSVAMANRNGREHMD